MSGPYNLKYIHLFVTEKSPGAFILSRNGRMADRVERADHNLAHALQKAASEGKYRYFWFEYTSKASAAFDLECTWYHRYHPTDNVEHPVGLGKADGMCSVKGCTTGALAGIRG